MAVHILRRASTTVVIYMTPFEAYFGKKPNVSYFRGFGFDNFVHVLKLQCIKLDPKSQKMVFVGYQVGSKGILSVS